MRRLVATTSLLAVSLLVPGGSAGAQEPAESPCSTDKAHQFDFWLGEWEVTSGDQVAGTNHIKPLLDGCVVMENWIGTSGSKGSSFNFYDPQRQEWRQLWVWQNGTTIETAGHYEDGKMILEGETLDREGAPILNRITFYDNADGTVRQHWEISRDGGESWQTAFDGLYRKKG